MGDTIRFNSNITINEINIFIEDYYKKWLQDERLVQNSLTFEFSENVEFIDELFYAYLLLFKQNFPKIQIVFDIKSNKPKQIAKQHIVFLNTSWTN
ncbi:MAG: hypothetical protein LBU51_08600 [Bacteroidales bacterium]|jgi:hypothetical protein|nr:hypothetical protein [Bacteroidales bacterium]